MGWKHHDETWDEFYVREKREKHERAIAGRDADIVKLRAAIALARTAPQIDEPFLATLGEEIAALEDDNTKDRREMILEATGATIGRRSF